jgi:hypothetical protein
VLARGDLRVIAAALQLVAGGRGQLGRAAGVGERPGEEVADERLGRDVGRVVDHETVGPEHVIQHPAKRLRHAVPAGVGVAQHADESRRELGDRQRRLQGVHGEVSLPVEHQAGDRPLAGALEVAETHGVRMLVVIEHRARPHLFPVVIFGVDPEDGHRRHTVVPGHAARQFDGGDGLVQGVERAAEQSGLLAGHDGHRPRVGEGGRGGPSRRRGAARGLLRREQVRQRRYRSRDAGLHLGDHRAPGLVAARIAGVERRQAVERERVVGGEAAHPRQLTYVDREAASG